MPNRSKFTFYVPSHPLPHIVMFCEIYIFKKVLTLHLSDLLN